MKQLRLPRERAVDESERRARSRARAPAAINDLAPSSELAPRPISARMSPLQPTLLLRPRLAAAALARSALCDACGDGLLRLRGGGPEALPMDRRTGWAILFGATLFELVSTWFMNEAKGFTKPLESIGACVFYAASFYTFNVSLRALEISVAYAVWSAVVMAALAAIGMLFFGESVSIAKVSGISAIIAGTVALSLAGVE